MRLGTNENRAERVTLGDGGPMRWGTNESGGPMRWGTNGMGDAWVLIGGPMRWGTNEMGDQ